MKKIFKTVCIITGIVVALLTVLYVGLSVYYADGFSYGTWVNGIYCTGKSVDEINQKLILETKGEVHILCPDGTEETIALNEISQKIDFTDALNNLLKQQNSWQWYKNLGISARNQRLEPKYSFDEKLIREKFEQLSFVKYAKPEEDYKVYISYNPDQGYLLQNERTHVIDIDKCYEIVVDALNQSNWNIELTNENCYCALPLDSDMEKTVQLFQIIDDFQTCNIVYQFGEEQIPITKAEVCKWLEKGNDNMPLVGEDGLFVINEERMDEFVDSLADEYDSIGAERSFKASRGEIVTISGGTYGNELDRKSEKQYLRDAFWNHKSEIHEPAYLHKAWQQGKDDIGNTYIEVDMGQQQMYYYENGEQIIQTPIVTGNMMRKRDTPAMVCFVYAKQKNRVLRGPGYAAPVKYWMPVKGGIGIHDAKWRKEFGGDIYKTDGSHGCINTPDDAMTLLYERAEIGTPVVMFY